MIEIERSKIKRLLKDWFSDRIDEDQVHREAEYIIDNIHD